MGNVSLSHCFLKLEHASVIGLYGGPHEAHVTGPLPQCLECMSLELVPRICISQLPGNANADAIASGPEHILWEQVGYKKGMKDWRAKE